jgi:mRNA-degrading endonuclease toxin of MazEF toxin-antitoxin module
MEYILIGFTPKQLERLRAEAKQQKISVNALVRTATDSYVLQKRAERNPKEDWLSLTPKSDDKTRGEIWTLTPKAVKRLGVPKAGRPWLIVQSNNFRAFGSRLACPITMIIKHNEGQPFEIRPLKDTDVWFGVNVASCNSIYTVRKDEFNEFKGMASDYAYKDQDVMSEVDEALKLALGLK